jgi:predicted dehydrogenase
MKKKVAIIGAGLQARRRAPAIAADPEYELTLIIDRKEEKAKALAKDYGAHVSTDWKTAMADSDIDVVMILTYPDSHAMMSLAAMEAGKDVLCEKPLSRTEEEAQTMIETANRTGRILKCGFNHRFHPAVLEAHRLFAAGEIGRPVFGRARYGIAGREGLEREWRSDPKIVSGGQLMEQGIHLVDLFRWFLGDMSRVTGMTTASHWPMPPPLEDNGFVVMQNKSGVICSIHSSLTQWINLFEFEIYGAHGSVTVHGLGTSYGVEKLTISEHDPNGPFASRTIEYRDSDSSWKSEWMEFTRAIAKRGQPLGSGEDGLRAMQIVNAAYAASRDGRTIHLDN